MDGAKDCGGCILIFILLVDHVVSAHEPICSTSYNLGKTTFEVSLELHPDEYNCEHSWSDDNNFVIANGEGLDDTLVLSNTNTSLVVFGCNNNITYELNCESGSKLEYARHRTTCIANCTVISQNSPSIFHNHFSLIPVIFIAIVIVIVVAVLIICK